MIENVDPDGLDDAGLPISLAEEVTLVRDIAKDGRIRMGDVR
jgi:hypothetical protein